MEGHRGLSCAIVLFGLIVATLGKHTPIIQLDLRQAGLPGSTLRNATEADVDDIATAYIEAYKNSEEWKYVLLPTDQVPANYTFICRREAFRQRFIPGNEAPTEQMNVISVPDNTSSRGERVISIAIWDFNLTATPRGNVSPPTAEATANNCSARLDRNATRDSALEAQDDYVEAEQAFFIEPYGDDQLYLSLLATLPDYDDAGVDAMQIAWGKDEIARLNRERKADSKPIPITTEDLHKIEFYVEQGFTVVENATKERLDGGPVLWHAFLVYEEGNGTSGNSTTETTSGGVSVSDCLDRAVFLAWLLMVACVTLLSAN